MRTRSGHGLKSGLKDNEPALTLNAGPEGLFLGRGRGYSAAWGCSAAAGLMRSIW